jgi:NADPH:quinone reductase-like Zn-dependent oxidoreductase
MLSKRYLVTVFGFRDWLRMLWTRIRGTTRMIGGAANFHWVAEDLLFFRELVEQGRWKSVIDRSYPWREAAQAHSYVEQGHKRSNVVLMFGEAGEEERAQAQFGS